MTRRLLQLGHRVIAVDASQEMLLYVPSQASKIHAAIEDLSLEDRFPVVLLASNLVNTVDKDQRHRLLASCRRHVSSDGVVVIQRYEPTLSEWKNTDWYTRGDVEVRIQDFERSGDLFSAKIEYRAGPDRFAQRFSAQLLDDGSLAADLAAVGLSWVKTIDAEGSWVLARPGPETQSDHIAG
jgi:ubiquinone/menaquinone biosynthesis C-methylase UbiE